MPREPLDLLKVFEAYCANGVEQLPAAILTLAEMIQSETILHPDLFGHELCMSIRHGISGDGAPRDLRELTISGSLDIGASDPIPVRSTDAQ